MASNYKPTKEPRKVIIPAGTFLYRASDNICEAKHECIDRSVRLCSDTGKTGLYFGNYLLIALAMSLEYKKSTELGVFITIKDIEALHGKYSYVMIHPERFATHIHPETLLPNEHVCHFNNAIGTYCEYNIPTGLNLGFGLGENEGEVFLNGDQVKNAVLVASYKLNYQALKKTIETLKASSNSFTDYDIPRYDINFYIHNGVLEPFGCNTPITKGGKRSKIRCSKSTRRRRHK